jgi:hypothetical protein
MGLVTVWCALHWAPPQSVYIGVVKKIEKACRGNCKIRRNYPDDLEKIPSPTTNRIKKPIPVGQKAKRLYV